MTNFDDIITPPEQSKWLQNFDYSPLGTFESSSDDANIDHIQDFEKLRNLAVYDDVIGILRQYIKIAVPFPLTTLPEYWMCTCFSEPNLIVRINIRDQVVLSIWDEHNLTVYWTLHENVDDELSEFINKSNLRISSRWGKQRVSLEGVSYRDAMGLMNDKEFINILRQCNLSLMQSGKVIWQKDHNFYLAFAMCDSLESDDLESTLFNEDEVLYSEGHTVEYNTWRQVRSKSLIKDAKEKFKQVHGKLYCEVCDFNFSEFYGKSDIKVDTLIEAHHTIPLHNYDMLTNTNIDNIRMVCPNCHRMLHSKKPLPYTIEELRSILSR